MSKKSFLSIISAVAAICVITACSHSKENSINEDSIRIADSIAKVESEAAQREALRQDSLARVEHAKYNEMIAECEKEEKSYNYYSGKVLNPPEGDYTDYYTPAMKAYERYRAKYEAILEVIDNFTPEQFARVQEIEKNLGDPIWG